MKEVLYQLETSIYENLNEKVYYSVERDIWNIVLENFWLHEQFDIISEFNTGVMLTNEDQF